MPLDGDDEVGMSCILLSLPMDRSMKNLQTWRPYEIKNGGDGKTFDNKFTLLTLRYANQDAGTLEMIRAALGPQDTAQVKSKIASQAMAATACSISEVVPTVEGGHPGLSNRSQARSKSRKRTLTDNSSASLD
jgi:hypothetical protein